MAKIDQNQKNRESLGGCAKRKIAGSRLEGEEPTSFDQRKHGGLKVGNKKTQRGSKKKKVTEGRAGTK